MGWCTALGWAARCGVAAIARLRRQAPQNLVFEREHGRESTGVHEDDRAVGTKPPTAGVVDQAGHGFARVNGVEDESLETGCQAHCFEATRARLAIRSLDVFVVAFDIRFVEVHL